MSFQNRVFGCVIVKSINSNYNADFSHQPRTLPDGTVYATDKALKYAIKNYLKDMYSDEKVFYFKRFDKEFKPFSLDEAYADMFPDHADEKNKTIVAKDILSCLDIRLFGATFAKKGKSKDSNVAISVHGPVQINHGVNIWHENNIFSEQIMSPFRNPKASDDEEGKSDASTLGRQSKLQEGHYLHHFSINPNNLKDITVLAGEGAASIAPDDITKLKEAMRKGVTYYDSAAKAGTDNELLLWVQLKKDSKVVLPNFNRLVTVKKDDNKMVFDFARVTSLLEKYTNDVESVEIYYQSENTKVDNLPANAQLLDLN